LRLLKEVNGFPCYDLEAPVVSRKNMIVSRSFSKDVDQLSELTEAVASYATRLGEKLRHDQQQTGVITVFCCSIGSKTRVPMAWAAFLKR
jgi:DNA polymerase V